MLDQLPGKETDPLAYRDSVPYVLDRLENVWRMIHIESKGRRTAEFGMWWANQLKQQNRRAINVLRNAELKENLSSTAQQRILLSPGFVRVHEDGSITTHDAAGGELPRNPGAGLAMPTPVEVESRWIFAVDGLRHRSVQETLELVYSRLSTETLPEAERLLRDEG